MLTELQVVDLYKQVFDQFLEDHPDYTGTKIIFAPLRRVDNNTMDHFIQLASELKVHLCFDSVIFFRSNGTCNETQSFQNQNIIKTSS